ncbi:MAG: hypothetical protein Q8R08_02450 [bacterium]|nr:hypothetical protein [bacterium]
MSRQLARATLEGYDGPVRVSTDELMRVWNKRRLECAELLRVCKDIRGFFEDFRPETVDGREWFWGGNFKIAGKKVAVLFPWQQSRQSKDGRHLDRIIGVYTAGQVSLRRIEALLTKIAQKIRDRQGVLAS